VQQESEIRLKISRELEEHIEKYRENDFSNEYIMGMERARLLALYQNLLKSSGPTLDVQEKLF
jgi:hypothetical protein